MTPVLAEERGQVGQRATPLSFGEDAKRADDLKSIF
jgi:hypothetical protein